MVKKIASNSHVYTHDGFKCSMLLISDVHFDSAKCDRELLKKHLDEIKAKNGIILIIGDLFDVMGTFRDPRSKPEDIRPEYYVKGRAYLDLIVEDCYEFLKPYKENLKLIGYGNHETNINRRHDTDVIDRLVFLLNMEKECVHKGAYQGFFNIRMKRGGTRAMFNVAYHHGHGGARRSKGVLNSQLDAMRYPDADLIISGHDHNKIYDPSNVQIRLDGNLKPYQSAVHWMKLGSYKKSATDFGYEVQSGYFPSKLGGWFCDLSANRRSKKKDNGKRADTVRIDPHIYEAT